MEQQQPRQLPHQQALPSLPLLQLLPEACQTAFLLLLLVLLQLQQPVNARELPPGGLILTARVQPLAPHTPGHATAHRTAQHSMQRSFSSSASVSEM
jgi:hypothetical protein